MQVKIRAIEEVDVGNKRVLLRTDYNVPLDEEGNICNDRRIKSSLPTINYLLKNNAKIIIITHLGRPKGKVVNHLRVDKIRDRLNELLNMKIKKVDECIGDNVIRAVEQLKSGEILLLENVRFYEAEEAKDEQKEAFAKELAKLADVYINDGFSVAHRDHASVYTVCKFFKEKAAGILFQKEINYLSSIFTGVPRPFIIILGGAKLKLKLIGNLINKVNKLLLGGKISYYIFDILNINIGEATLKKLDEKEKELLYNIYNTNKEKIILPKDHIVAQEVTGGEKKLYRQIFNTSSCDIPLKHTPFDIGKETIKEFLRIINEARTILWSGPMGKFEVPQFRGGTEAIAKGIAESSAEIKIAGGGETDKIIDELNIEDKFTHVSSAGGAMLKFLEGEELPGIAGLKL